MAQSHTARKQQSREEHLSTCLTKAHVITPVFCRFFDMILKAVSSPRIMCDRL